MNIWRRGSLSKNPYYRTAFCVARVSCETTRHRTIVQLIGQTRRIVNTNLQAHMIKAEPVSDAEINTAEQILLDPKQRIVEELLQHTTEKPPLARIHRLVKKVTESMTSENIEQLPVTNFGGLQTWARSLVHQFINGKSDTKSSFGAFELNVAPPFGDLTEM